LDDDEVPLGNWWSVGKEALAMLGSMHPPVADYRARLELETQHVFSNVDATVEDRRWAEGYATEPLPNRLWKKPLTLYPGATGAATHESE
jgi:hypothetical protein